ncbi:hypothetical protein MNBD_UNCLBAC01-749 [hydrothermal vent metagenome]|uniref:YhcG N-terminal domain-containing protein n=1 Tax=hydrothermal vent metagenome TaxID=652676 RepID=A0A3B1DUD9_9ZZZZ
MTLELKPSDYQNLLSNISAIYSQSQIKAQQTVNQILIQTYWKIGKQIVSVQQKNKLRAQYGEHLLEHLSEDLMAQYGKGFSVTNLKRMRMFFTAFQIRPTLGELSWSHYQILSMIESSEKREAYEKKTIKLGWSFRELNEQLKQSNASRHTKIILPEEKKIFKLQAKYGKLYTYRVKISSKITLPKNHILIDFGFDVWREVPSTLSSVKDKQIVEIRETSKGFKAIASIRKRKDLYFYKAYMERVVDGDTLLVNIDAGPNVWIRKRLRLKGINAPELSTKAGLIAKAYLENILKDIPFIVLKTNQVDMYYRYIADVFYLPEELDPFIVGVKGTFLNQELLDAGVVERME